MTRLPHLIIFNPDQFRADAMGHLGNPASVTPNFDEMCREDAVSFGNAFCQNPVCTPSRCSFMSGWYPHVRGHRSMRYMMHEDEPVLLRQLKEKGYHIWWGGKNDLVPGNCDFDLYCDVKYQNKDHCKKLFGLLDEKRGDRGGDAYYSYYIGRIDKGEEERFFDRDWDCIEGAIHQIKNRPGDKPLCIYLPLLYPHVPYAVEEPWFGIIDREKLPPRIRGDKCRGNSALLRDLRLRQGLTGWREARWDELRATYLGMCSRLDTQFGMIIDALREEGIYGDTAVFVLSDHGDFTGDYDVVSKADNIFTDCLVNVPLIIKPPAWVDVKPGVNDSLVELVDFYATVAELTGITAGHTHFGRSLVPVMEEGRYSHREAVFSEGGRLLGEDHLKGLFGPAVPESYSYPLGSLQDGDGPHGGKAVMIRTRDYKYIRRIYERDELYDLCSDPHETENRIGDSRYRTVLADLKERLLDFYLETADAVPLVPDMR